MNNGRWYPTVIHLGEKGTNLGTREIIAITGYKYDDINTINPNVEFYNPASGWSPVNSLMDKVLPLYVGGQVIPYGPYAGEIFYDILGWFFTQPTDELGQAWRFNPDGSPGSFWHTVDSPRPSRNQGLSFPIPLFPGSQSFKVVNVTGLVYNSLTGVTELSNKGEVIDLNIINPSYSNIPNIPHPRWHGNSTVLPDARTLVTGGNKQFSDSGYPIYLPDMFDAEIMDWVNWQLAEMQPIPRGYHSNGILYEDGSVWVSGGNYQTDPNLTLKIQRYYPGYFFEGTRPTINSAPTNISYGQSFGINIDLPIETIALIRPGSVTHGINFGQRYIGLKPVDAIVNGGYTYNPQAPANRNIAPPGYYMLFVCRPKSASDSGAYRIPSVAHWVKLS